MKAKHERMSGRHQDTLTMTATPAWPGLCTCNNTHALLLVQPIHMTQDQPSYWPSWISWQQVSKWGKSQFQLDAVWAKYLP